MFLSDSMIDRAITQLTNGISQTVQANSVKSVPVTQTIDAVVQDKVIIPSNAVEKTDLYVNDKFYEPVLQQSVAVPKPKTISQPIKHEQSKFWLYIKNFFAVNALAKIGGILLFL
jgi:hypothetical protein